MDADADDLESGFSFGTLAGLNMWAMYEAVEEDKRLGTEWCTKLRERRREIAIKVRRDNSHTPAERMRAMRARRAAEGKCSLCERYRAPGKSRCEDHLKVQRKGTK